MSTVNGHLDAARDRLRAQAGEQLRLHDADGRTLSAGDVEAIAEATARKVAALVGAPAPATFALIDARELADRLGVQVEYIYRHQVELGALKLGTGPKARMKFDLDVARQALEARRRSPRKPGRRARA